MHAGVPDPVQHAPLLPGPSLVGPVHLAGDPPTPQSGYGRYVNASWTHYERALGELDGGEAVVFASGMAAVTAVLLTALGADGVLVAPSDGYPGVRSIARDQLEPRGIEVRLVPTEDAAIAAALDGATLVWLESPSNPGLDVCDLARSIDLAHAHGARVAVDNTLATPLAQRPIPLGADWVVTSGTKALSGHSDLLIGNVTARTAAGAEPLRAWRAQTGGIAGPFECWLAHRSLATLDVRLSRQSANALALAELLAARPDVTGVRYPGLPSDPAHAVAARQMARFGPVVGLTLDGAQRAQRFLTAAELVTEATSFGGVHTTAERRARWGGDAVPEGFIRLSAGLEDPRDLCADLARALDLTAQ